MKKREEAKRKSWREEVRGRERKRGIRETLMRRSECVSYETCYVAQKWAWEGLGGAE